jgi:hypothetical protein
MTLTVTISATVKTANVPKNVSHQANMADPATSPPASSKEPEGRRRPGDRTGATAFCFDALGDREAGIERNKCRRLAWVRLGIVPCGGATFRAVPTFF